MTSSIIIISFSFYVNKQLFWITKILPCLTYKYARKEKMKTWILFFFLITIRIKLFFVICICTRYKSLMMCDQDLPTTHSRTTRRDDIKLMLAYVCVDFFLLFYIRTKSWRKLKTFYHRLMKTSIILTGCMFSNLNYIIKNLPK
jgi:hypothetical protein